MDIHVSFLLSSFFSADSPDGGIAMRAFVFSGENPQPANNGAADDFILRCGHLH
jgi:hypothetical protein